MLSEPWLIAIVINAVLLVAAAWGGSIRTTWKVAAIKADIIAAINTHAKEVTIEFMNVRKEVDDTARSFGETVAALKQAFNDQRLEAAQTYVRREGFWKAHENLTKSIDDFRRETREDLQRLERKFDTKTQDD